MTSVVPKEAKESSLCVVGQSLPLLPLLKHSRPLRPRAISWESPHCEQTTAEISGNLEGGIVLKRGPG